MLSNGHVPPGSRPGYTQANGGSRVNVTANPMADLESHDDQSLHDLRASIQEMLGSAPPPPQAVMDGRDSQGNSHYDSDRSTGRVV